MSGEALHSSEPLRPAEASDRGLLSAREAARYLGISERTLFSLTVGDGLRCVRIGRRKLYGVRTLEDWIKRKEAEGGKSRA